VTPADETRKSFVVARNPKPGTRLPYVVRLPVAGEPPLVLACREEWPGPKDVFCLELDAWPEDAEVIKEVPVQSCWRSGKAVHLVLERRLRRRSMFVWTQGRGRTLIFWRTQRTMRAARPGLRVPQARGLEAPLSIAVDIREGYPWRFTKHRAECVTRELPVGDYGVFLEDRLCAAVERKDVPGLAAAAVGGTLSFALAELSRLPHAALVVEGRLSDLLKPDQKVRKGWLMSVVASLQVQYPRVNWMFAETRELAEDFTFRWLGAARKAELERAAAPSEEPAPGRETPRIAESAQMALPVYDRRGRFDEAIKLADQGRVWTTAEYAAHFGVSKPTARKDLSDLVAAGALSAEGGRRDRRYVRVRKG